MVRFADRVINLGRVESIIFANKYRSQKGDAMAGRHKGERIVYGSLESVLGKCTKEDLNMAGDATISDAFAERDAKAKQQARQRRFRCRRNIRAGR